MTVFKGYDIRGIYPKEIDENFAYKLGLNCTKIFKKKKVLVGQDARKSSFSLKKFLIKGLLTQGFKVFDCGIVPIVSLYHWASKFRLPAIMVTASHNPLNYNGFKLIDENGFPIRLKKLEKVKQISSKKGSYEKVNVLKEHLNFLKKFEIEKEFSIGVDFLNSPSFLLFLKLLKWLKINAVVFNVELGKFFQQPLPSPQNLKDLKKEIKEKNLDFGIAFDGDADRIVFFDDKGNYLWGDWVLTILIKYLLPISKNKKVVCEVTCTNKLKEIVKEMNGKVYETKVGRYYLVREMKKRDALLGGESSSHFYFKESRGLEDSFLAFLKILQILERENKKLSEIVKEINFHPKTIFSVKKINLEKIQEKFESKRLKDGIKFLGKNFEFIVRKSQTEEVFRIYLEAENKKVLRKAKEKLTKSFKKEE
jgi:phosphomannomutase